jgi:molybdenum cofactor cytidylyltransferase
MISAILLAAGLSSRMNGENKLIKEINDKPLIVHSIKNLLGSAVNEIIIVLGYEKDVVENLIEQNKKIKIVFNKDYKKGVSASIKTGLANISSKSEFFFICLGDMPNVNQNIYNKMIKTIYNYNKKLKPNFRKEIVIPTFEGKDGNPILFSKYMKSKLKNIEGDKGAKELINLYKNKSINVPIKNSGIILDFDSIEDFNFS